MPETWPAELPQRFQRDGFQEAMANNTISSQPDIGPPKRRRRTTSNVSPMSGTMILSGAQWDTLETFFYDTIQETLPFEFPDPDDIEETLVVCFVNPPKRTATTPGRYRVSLELEIQP